MSCSQRYIDLLESVLKCITEDTGVVYDSYYSNIINIYDNRDDVQNKLDKLQDYIYYIDNGEIYYYYDHCKNVIG